MSSDRIEEDIRLFLTVDEVERLIKLLDQTTQREPLDRRLVRILETQYHKHQNLKGGTNA